MIAVKADGDSMVSAEYPNKAGLEAVEPLVSEASIESPSERKLRRLLILAGQVYRGQVQPTSELLAWWAAQREKGDA